MIEVLFPGDLQLDVAIFTRRIAVESRALNKPQIACVCIQGVPKMLGITSGICFFTQRHGMMLISMCVYEYCFRRTFPRLPDFISLDFYLWVFFWKKNPSVVGYN